MRKLRVIPLAMAIALTAFMAAPASATTIDVKIYSGLTGVGGGEPYSGFVDHFDSPDIQFATNTGYAWHPFGLNSFGADMFGNLNVAVNGTYSFLLNSDDGSELFIDSLLVINNGGPHSPTIATGSELLTAGIHPFEVRFFEDFGGPSGVDMALPRGVSYAPAPEPASMVLLGSGLAGLVARRRRTKV